MKKVYRLLGMAMCIGLGSVGVSAQEKNLDISVVTNEVQEETKIVYPINMEIPITRAEFILTIVQTTGIQLSPIMDTHYAMAGMLRAEELGLIDLKDYPIDTWSQTISMEEKIDILTKAIGNTSINMKKVYEAFNKILIEQIKVNYRVVDLKGISMKHYRGKLMLPVRPIAEKMGFDVIWDQRYYSATLNNGKIKSEIQVGFDAYDYTSMNGVSMSNPFSVGAAPCLIDGTLYVAVEYFSMFANIEISNGTIQFILK